MFPPEKLVSGTTLPTAVLRDPGRRVRGNHDPLARSRAGSDDSVEIIAACRLAGRKGNATMAHLDLRLRVWGWLTRRMVSVATMNDAEVIALQGRRMPANAVTNWLFGAVAPEVKVTDRTVPGPAGDLKVRVYE